MLSLLVCTSIIVTFVFASPTFAPYGSANGDLVYDAGPDGHKMLNATNFPFIVGPYNEKHTEIYVSS